MIKLGIDNTKRSCFTQCPKKYYFQFVKHLKPLKGSTALRFGSTYHAFQEEYRKQMLLGSAFMYCQAKAVENAMLVWEKEENCGQLFETDYRTFLRCLETFQAYLEFYKGGGDFIPKKVEHVFSIPFCERGDYQVFFEGKIDLIGCLPGEPHLSVVDDKTSGYTVHHVFAEKRAQLMGYCWASSKLDSEFKVNQAYINLAFIKESVTKKFGSVITTEFHRMPYFYSDKIIAEWYCMMQEECKRIIKAHQENNFYQVTDSCQTKYGSCEYLTLCGMSGNSEDYVKANFVEKKWEVTAE